MIRIDKDLVILLVSLFIFLFLLNVGIMIRGCFEGYVNEIRGLFGLRIEGFLVSL
jgi:hypothetical protein